MTETENQQREGEQSGIQRIEAFSDGVFAIAITLLILEIKVPRLTDHLLVTDLAKSLISLWVPYLSYIFSFVSVGIYWANHHYLFNFLSELTMFSTY